MILVSAVAVLHAVKPKLIGSIPRERNSYAFTASRAEIPLDELRRDALGLETKRYPCGTRHQHLSRICNAIRLQLVDSSTNNRTKNVSRHSVNGERQSAPLLVVSARGIENAHGGDTTERGAWCSLYRERQLLGEHQPVQVILR